MKQRRILFVLTILICCFLTACGGNTPPLETSDGSTTYSEPTTPPDSQETTSAAPSTSTQTSDSTAPEAAAKLYVAFDLEQPDTYDLPYTGTLDAAALLQGLSRLTGWNCDVNRVEILSGTARIDLAPTSLPFAYDDQQRNDPFFLSTYVDTVFLFLDSVNQTLTQNLGLTGVIFTQNGGEPLQLDQLFTTVELFPADTIYRSSAYYRALLQDDPYSNANGYPMVQLAGGMTLLYPNGFNIDGETDTEFRVSAEDRVFLVYRSYALETEDTTGAGRTPEQLAEAQAKKSMEQWSSYMSEVSEQSYTSAGYELDGKVGSYRFHATGFMAPVKSAYYEVTFMYEEDIPFVNMETVVQDISFALSKYN